MNEFFYFSFRKNNKNKRVPHRKEEASLWQIKSFQGLSLFVRVPTVQCFFFSSVFVISLLSDEYTHAYCFFFDQDDEHFTLPDQMSQLSAELTLEQSSKSFDGYQYVYSHDRSRENSIDHRRRRTEHSF
jgi:hypothetical protein